MPEIKLAVAPFGDRWCVERSGRRDSIHHDFESAIHAAVVIACRTAPPGDDVLVLVRERDGAWREAWYACDCGRPGKAVVMGGRRNA